MLFRSYAIIEGPSNGWLSTETLGLFAVALAAFATLVPYELHRDQPLIEVRFFASAPFSGASVIAICAFAGIGGFLFLNTLYLQVVRGLSPFDAGLSVLPLAAGTLFMSPLSGRLVGSRGSRLPLVGGSLAVIISGLLLTRLTATTPLGVLLVSYLIYGIGFGLLNPPITNTAVSGMPASQAGVAAAIASTSRQVGATLGIAVLGSLAAGATAGAVGPSFPAATHASSWVLVGLGVTALCLGILTTTKWANDTARRTAKRFREDQFGARGGDGSRRDGAELVTG